MNVVVENQLNDLRAKENKENGQAHLRKNGSSQSFRPKCRFRIASTSSLSSLSFNQQFYDESHQQALWCNNPQFRASLVILISALYALLLVILAVSFEVSTLVVDEVVSSKYDPFYLYLYLVGLLFFAYCHAFLLRSKGWKLPVPFYSAESRASIPSDKLNFNPSTAPLKPNGRNVSHSGVNAGSLYLRLGTVAFCIVSLIDHGLQIFRALDSGQVRKCYNKVGLAEDIGFMVFIFVQMYFVFENSKMVIRRFKHIGRLGTMHLVATNLCIWIRGVAKEQHLLMTEIANVREVEHRSDSNSTFTIRKHLPPSIESYDCRQIQKQIDDLIGNVKPFMTTCTVEYAMICSAFMYVMWDNVGKRSRKVSKIAVKRENYRVDCSSSTMGLFAGLLFLVFVIVSMVVFFTKMHLEEDSQALWVLYISDGTLYTFSGLAVAAGFYKMRRFTFVPYRSKEMMLDNILLIVTLIGQLLFCVFSVVALTKIDLTSAMIVGVSVLRMIQVLMQTVFVLCAQCLSAPSASEDPRSQKPGREIVTFLILCNLGMFLINTFEKQKAGANVATLAFYGKDVWTMIVYSTVPLTIFYRFHSSVCLAEVWKSTYQIKHHVLNFI